MSTSDHGQMLINLPNLNDYMVSPIRKPKGYVALALNAIDEDEPELSQTAAVVMTTKQANSLIRELRRAIRESS